jgi:acyl-CoA thioesterase FadM
VTVDGFPFSMRQEVVLRDLDAFGHVNNAVFLT